MKLITTFLTVLGLSIPAPILVQTPSQTTICEDWKLDCVLISKTPLPFEQYSVNNSQIIDIKVTKDTMNILFKQGIDVKELKNWCEKAAQHEGSSTYTIYGKNLCSIDLRKK
jgi:hypothetical protein